MRLANNWLARAARMRLNIFHATALLAAGLFATSLVIAPLAPMAVLMAVSVLVLFDEAQRERRIVR